MGSAAPLSAFGRPVRFKERKVVKRIRILTSLSVLAVALSVGLLPGVAKANSGSSSPNQVTIQQQASSNLQNQVDRVRS